MTIVDVNVLLYAVNAADAKHDVAARWLGRALGATEAIGIPWVTILAFTRLSTSASVFPSPLSAQDALAVIEEWLSQRAAVIPVPTPRHIHILRGLLNEAGTAGNLVADAHLATLALEHGAHVATFDRDFRRFGGLQLVIPGE